jgi:hypothetical protein
MNKILESTVLSENGSDSDHPNVTYVNRNLDFFDDNNSADEQEGDET